VPAAEAADLGASRRTVARVTEGHHSVRQLGSFDPGRRRTSPGRLEMGEDGVAEVAPFYIIISFVYLYMNDNRNGCHHCHPHMAPKER
jgi:hypothetical protein